MDCNAQFKKVNSNGLDIHYRVIGSGTPVLIIGGGPGDNANRYLSLCELLSKNFQCILVDQRGTGKSIPAVLDSTTISIELTLSDFEAIIKKLGLNEWVVMGFSYGGYIASLYVNYYPNSVSKLILLNSLGLNPNVFAYFVDNINSKLRLSDLELFDYWNDSARVALNPHRALVERIRARMPGYFYDRKKSLIVSQEMKDSDFNFEMGQWIWKDVVKRNLDLAEMESKYDKPVLILHGRQDPLGESVPQSLFRYYKNSELKFIEKCGHYSWIEQSGEVFKSIREFQHVK
jgi:proline iminopeptidase